MKFRHVIFWFHLLCGLVAGIVVFIMSITGAVLTYEKQIAVWADRNLYQVQDGRNVAQLSAETLIEKGSGQLINSDKCNDQDPGLRARIWLRFVHTGEYYGIPG